MLQCPSCARLQEPRLICTDCGAPLAANLDYFATLGLQRQLRIDLATLEAGYHELGRAVHPDRFASVAPGIRDASLRATALLTRAYRTLRDPAARAVYWLELHGERLAQNNQQVPAALAGLVFEAQEEIAELRGLLSRKDEPAAAAAREQVKARELEVAGLLAASGATLERIFVALDQASGAAPVELIQRLKAALAEGAYLGTLRRDLHKALDSKTEA